MELIDFELETISSTEPLDEIVQQRCLVIIYTCGQKAVCNPKICLTAFLWQLLPMTAIRAFINTCPFFNSHSVLFHYGRFWIDFRLPNLNLTNLFDCRTWSGDPLYLQGQWIGARGRGRDRRDVAEVEAWYGQLDSLYRTVGKSREYSPPEIEREPCGQKRACNLINMFDLKKKLYLVLTMKITIQSFTKHLAR